MIEINFGHVARFYDGAEVLAAARQGASYRPSQRASEDTNSMDLLRVHLQKYYSASSEKLNCSDISVDVSNLTEDQKLEFFFIN